MVVIIPVIGESWRYHQIIPTNAGAWQKTKGALGRFGEKHGNLMMLVRPGDKPSLCGPGEAGEAGGRATERAHAPGSQRTQLAGTHHAARLMRPVVQCVRSTG